MTTFVSYASEYDNYIGTKSIGELSAEEQDEIIRSVLSKDGDFRELVVKNGIKKSQAEGLWSLFVFVGLALEAERRIKSFDERNDEDIQEIISFFSGTNLCLRIEEAYSPFDYLEKKTDYTWSELEKIKIEHLTESSGEPLYKIKSKICEYLASSPSQLTAECIDRMPYHTFKQTYDEGKLTLFVDKGLSTVVGRSGMIRSPLLSVFSVVFFLGLLAFIPLWIFSGFWYGLAALATALVSKKLTTQLLVKETRKLAISDKQIYRWLLSRRIIWMRYHSN